MADKPIGSLPTAENIADGDSFVLEQNSTAKRLTGKTLVSFLLNRLSSHGGITSIEKVSSQGLAALYDINFSDGTSQRITITNGRGITGIDKVSTNGNVDTYAIRYNDGTSTQFTVLNGTNGKNGKDAYVWVRYASVQPSNASPSFGEAPDRWMGVYSGPDATAPKEWSAYKWYDTKGDSGLSIYRVNGPNRPLYRYSYNDLIMPADHTPKVGDLVITTDGYLACVTQVFEDTELVDVESTDIRLGGDSYVELLYGDDGLTLFDAIESGKPVYLLYEDYRLPMVTWTTDVLSATFGGCYENKIVTCKFAGANWSVSVETIDGDSNVVIVTESTTQDEMITTLNEAWNGNKIVVLNKYVGGGHQLYYYAGNDYFFCVSGGVTEEAIYDRRNGTWTYNTVESGGDAAVFVGDENTTVTEFFEASQDGKACFMERPRAGSGYWTWMMVNANASKADFHSTDENGNIMYGRLLDDGTWSYEIKTDDSFQNVAEQDGATLGAELATANGWTLGTGWSGDFANGFTHTSGNTEPLTFAPSGIAAGKLYQVSFKSSVEMTTTNLFVQVGNSTQFNLYGDKTDSGAISIGVLATDASGLVFTPESSFTGTLTEISLKEITGTYEAVKQYFDTNGAVSFEIHVTPRGLENVFIGQSVGEMNTSGRANVGIGTDALAKNTSGFWNSAIGTRCLQNNIGGSRNIAIGYQSLMNNTVGQRNIAIGTFTMTNMKDGNWNIAIGADSMNEASGGDKNTAVGFNTLTHNQGNLNVAMGSDALAQNTTGTNNSAIGARAMTANTSGTDSVAVGFGAIQKGTTGRYNTAIGSTALYNLTTGQKNVAIGLGAGKSLTTGKRCIAIGADANLEATVDDQLNIGGLIKGSMASGSPYVEIVGGLRLPNIPTEYSNNGTQVWNNGGVLMVGAGGMDTIIQAVIAALPVYNGEVE